MDSGGLPCTTYIYFFLCCNNVHKIFFFWLQAAYLGNILCCEVLLLEGNAKLGEKDAKGRTPLYLSVVSGNKDFATYVLSKGSVFVVENWTPLYIACVNGNITIIKYQLEQGVDISKPGENGL